MLVTVDASELTEMAARLKALGFSDRRFAAGIATALTRTAKAAQEDVRTELPRVFDRPTPYTMKSLFISGATAAKLEARVWFKDDRATSRGGTPATEYLLPNVEGGPRRAKRLEQVLRMVRALPQGWFVVPGQGATLDSYGNISRGQVIQILSQLRATVVAGSYRNMASGKAGIAAQRRAGGRFFVMPVGNKGGVQPGVYQREFLGRNITPVLIFVQGTSYKRRFDFDGIVKRTVGRELQRNFARALDEQWQRLAARRGAQRD
jgi:hypothetical protein